MTTRTVLLSFHVAGGVLGLLVGLFAFHPPETPHFRLAIRRTYAAAIGILVTFLVAIVAVDWASLGPTPRIIFSVLIGLAAVIVTRLFLAFQLCDVNPRDGKPHTSTTSISRTSRYGKASSSLA